MRAKQANASNGRLQGCANMACIALVMSVGVLAVKKNPGEAQALSWAECLDIGVGVAILVVPMVVGLGSAHRAHKAPPG